MWAKASFVLFASIEQYNIWMNASVLNLHLQTAEQSLRSASYRGQFCDHIGLLVFSFRWMSDITVIWTVSPLDPTTWCQQVISRS